MQFALRTVLAFISSGIEHTLFRLALGACGGETLVARPLTNGSA
jgi:hypothetical protein